VTSGAQVPDCPRCGSAMVLRTASRGPHLGEDFWGCPRYPECRGTVAIQAPLPTELTPLGATSAAGASAQAEFDRRRARTRERIRQVWPVLVGVTLVVMLAAYLAIGGWLSPSAGALAAIGVLAAFAVAVFELPQTTIAWRKGAEGERRTATYLAGLEEAGFVVLHDRRVPGYGGNLDHVAIGPSGVWAIETKRLSGKVEISGDDVRIGGRRQDGIIDQAFREAIAVQVALRDQLDPLGLTVTPIICLHDGQLPWFNRSVRGVQLVSGQGLIRQLGGGEPRLSGEQVQAIAEVASARLQPAAPSARGSLTVGHP
jgi:ssDNA-binding Zn-finger/Zn-ribbon topoisomerase 1